MIQFDQVASLFVAIIALIVSIWVARRDGRWRESEEAKQLIDRVSKLEARAGKVETQLLDIPTKADLARVEGEVRTVGQGVTAAGAGIDRLEGYLLQRGLERVG